MKEKAWHGTGVRSSNDVDAYLAALPEPARSTLTKVRAAILSAVPPDATEVISYRMPMFKHNGMLVGYAAFPNHCSLFLATASLVSKFEKELAPYDVAKGTIRFPINKPLPAALVRKLVKARLAENAAREKVAAKRTR